MKDWKDTICYLLTHEDKEVQYRASVVVNNIVSHSKDLAERLLVPEIAQMLELLTKFGKCNFFAFSL